MAENSSPLLAAILLAIDLAADLDALAEWWASHKPALRHLDAAELQAAVSAKDRRKDALTPRPPPAAPPSMIPPPRRLPGYDGRRLL